MTWSEKFKAGGLHLPNALSILRGILGASLPFFLLSPNPSLHIAAATIFIFGAITDYWDGWFARRHATISETGKILDPSMDKILILVPLGAFAWMGFYPVIWIIPVFIREFIVTFCRIGWMLEGKALGAEKLGKLKFVFQVTAISAAFVHLLNLDFNFLGKSGSLAVNFLSFSILTALILTLLSGISFLWSNRANFLTPPFARYASACGVGLIPFAPGTMGSLLGLVLAVLCFWNSGLYAGVMLFFLAAGYWSVKRLDLSVVKDPRYVVVDEVLGMMLTLAAVPIGWNSFLAGFLFFRLFDVIKPFPCRQLERLPGYWGILLDDIGAGIYARLALLLFFG